MVKKISLAVMIIGLLGCESYFDLSEESLNKPLVDPKISENVIPRTSTYVREVTQREELRKKVVNVSDSRIKLFNAIALVFPNKTVSPSSGDVDLNKIIRVKSRSLNAEEYIEFLEDASDYDIQIVGNKIKVSSFISRQWNLAAFSDARVLSNRSVSIQSGSAESDSDGGAASEGGLSYSEISLDGNSDDWTEALEAARDIIGVIEDDEDEEDTSSDSTDTNAQLEAVLEQINLGQETNNPIDLTSRFDFEKGEFKQQEAYVWGARSVGIITAYGPAPKIKELDRYFKTLIESSETVFNIQVASYDVLLRESVEKGLDWDALATNAFGNDNLAVGITKNVAQGIGEGLFNITGTYTGSDTTATGILSFLKRFGEVTLKDQPSILARNGAPSKIYAGSEFSFVADFEQTTDESGTATVTPRFQRLNVGVTLSVTARVLGNKKILLDIWPVISRVSGETSFDVNGFAFETPIISLAEFSTQLITTSGTPVHLGGIITETVAKAVEGLPFNGGVIKNVVDPLTQNLRNEVERRELVLVVTPTLVEGVL